MSITPTGDASGALASLAVIAGEQAGEEVPLRSPVVNIGKGSQNDVVLTDDSVSTTHARLEYEDGAWLLTDLRSTNGTFIEEKRLAPEVPTPLPYGVTVRFGFPKLHFRSVEAADPDAARAAYTPPLPRETIRGRRTGARIPVWLIVLLLILVIVIGMLVFNWMWIEPAPVAPTAPAVLLPLKAPPPLPPAA